MKLFVTGSTGFIGSHFLKAALAANHHVVALRRPGSRARIPLQRDPDWIMGDLDSHLHAALTGCNVFVHLASHSTHPPHDSYANCFYWNTSASLRLAEQARECGITRFLVTGSCFEYGLSAERYKRIPTTAPLAPVSSYSASKAAASVAFQSFARQYQLQLKLLRLFQVYGEGEAETRLWSSLRRAALAGEDFPMTFGAQVRDFIAVQDVAEAIVAALEFDNVTAGVPWVANLGSGRSQTLRDFAQYWWTRWNAKGELLFGAVPYRNNEYLRMVPDLAVVTSDE